MRTWGRITNADGTKTWVEVSTGPDGLNQEVYVTWLAQVLKLNLGESPFWANWGIPQYQTIMTQIAPDYYMMQTQAFFAGKFASLAISRVPNTVDPTYNVAIVTKAGATITAEIPT
jgi:hypothetical protein